MGHSLTYRISLIFVFMVPLVVGGLLAWIANTRINDFEQSHAVIARNTTQDLSEDIANFIEEQIRLVEVFAEDEYDLILALASDPENEILSKKLRKRVTRFFPSAVTFTIADWNGDPILDDFEGYIGEVCRSDLRLMAKERKQSIRVHPNPYTYHFDVMAPWGGKDNGGIFFISFKTDALSNLLSSASSYRHELMLISSEVRDLIEVTTKGPRNVLHRDTFRLVQSELDRILRFMPVPNTRWLLADLRAPRLFAQYRGEILKLSLFIVVVFSIVSVVMGVVLIRLEQKRVMAERTKEEMFALFSHDLRSPLVSIRGLLGLVVNDVIENDPDRVKEIASHALDNAKTMTRIVDDILDLQQLELGKMEFIFERIDMVSLIRQAIDANRHYADQYNVSYEFTNPDKKLFVSGDKERLKQVMANLLTNAAKYSPEGGRVRVSIKSEDNTIRVSVMDNGPGISKEFQPYVFDKFAQSNTEHTKKVGGIGLGLAIVNHIVDHHRGLVGFETEEKVGTTFYFELPIVAM